MFQLGRKLEPKLSHTPMTNCLYLAYGFVSVFLVRLLRSLSHVCTLSGWSYDRSGGLCFPRTFRLPAFASWDILCPLELCSPSRESYWFPRPHRDYHVPQIQPDAVGSVYPPVVPHPRQTTPKRLVLTTYLLVWACQPL